MPERLLPLNSDDHRSFVVELGAHWYSRPLVFLWALTSITRDFVVTQGRRCETCGQRVYAWDRPIRGYSGRYSISASGEPKTSRWAVVGHRGCGKFER
jgi:hypothetical protein